MNDKVAAVLGVGPGLGAAVARRFAREGFAVALMARTEGSVAGVREEIEDSGGKAFAITADTTDAGSVASAFERVRSKLGDPEVFVYNAGTFEMGGVLEIPPERFDECFRANCAGAFYAAQQVLPAMIEAGRGTILMTGATASLRGSARFSALAVGKFGLRALGQSMAREFGPHLGPTRLKVCYGDGICSISLLPFEPGVTSRICTWTAYIKVGGVLCPRQSRYEPPDCPTTLAALAAGDAAARMPGLDDEVVGRVSDADDDELGNVGTEEMRGARRGVVTDDHRLALGVGYLFGAPG